MKNNKGFTLVEILAVITILGIIIIFALPAALDAIGKSRNKLNEYTKKNISDTAKMYFMDIVEKVDPDTKYYTIPSGEEFVSNVTGKHYRGGTLTETEINNGYTNQIFGYDFLIYTLLKSKPDLDSNSITNLSIDSEYFKYSGSTYFVKDSQNTPLNGSEIPQTGNLTVSIFDLVSGGYYNKECVYKGMKIKSYENGEVVYKEATKDSNCTLNSYCRATLTLETKINTQSNLLEIINYNINIPDEYEVSESELRSIMGLKAEESIPNDKKKLGNGNYLITNDCRIIS